MRIEDEIKQKTFSSEGQKASINIMFTASWVRGQVNCQLRPNDLTPEQYNVLRILNGQYPNAISLKGITERMIDRNSNTSRIVDKLKAKGLVSRETDEADRRGCNITITQAGLDMLREIENRWPDHNVISEKLAIEELEMLNKLLDKIRS